METYTENPRKWFVKTFEEPISEKKITLFNTKKGNIQICKQNSLSVENGYIVYKLRKYKEKVKATRNKTGNLYKKIHWLKKSPNILFSKFSVLSLLFTLLLHATCNGRMLFMNRYFI